MRGFGHDVELFDRGGRCAPRWRHPRTSAASGTAPAPPSSIPAGWRAASATRRSGAGVRVFEHSPATGLRAPGAGVDVHLAGAASAPGASLLATSAYPSLLRPVRRYVLPVYDYVLVTEPLDRARREAIGWRRRQGVGDAANRFHYYRLTADDRILWGGYDAVYRYGGPVGGHLDDHDPTFAKLSQHFFTTFPQLEGTRFTHRWGGAIDTCSRFSVFFGTAHRGRVAYATGYTGLGVARVSLRRPGGAGPAGRPRHGGHPPALRPPPAGALPARAAALGRGGPHPEPPGGGRRERRPPWALAPRARSRGLGLRLLDGMLRCSARSPIGLRSSPEPLVVRVVVSGPLADLPEERQQVLQEVVLRAGRVGVVVGVGGVTVHQHQVALRDARLRRQVAGRVQHPLSAERGPERVDAELPRQVVAVRGVHVEDLLRRVGVARGHRARVDRQALRVVPRRAVQALQAPAGEGAGVAPDRGDLARLVPAARVPARRPGARGAPARPRAPGGEVSVSRAYPYWPRFVTGTGGFRFAGSSAKA